MYCTGSQNNVIFFFLICNWPESPVILCGRILSDKVMSIQNTKLSFIRLSGAFS